jgi:hypothetical protein
MVQTTEGGCGTREAPSSLQALRRLCRQRQTSPPAPLDHASSPVPPRHLFAPLPPASAHRRFIHCLLVSWYVIRGLRPVLRARISLSLSVYTHISPYFFASIPTRSRASSKSARAWVPSSTRTWRFRRREFVKSLVDIHSDNLKRLRRRRACTAPV